MERQGSRGLQTPLCYALCTPAINLLGLRRGLPSLKTCKPREPHTTHESLEGHDPSPVTITMRNWRPLP